MATYYSIAANKEELCERAAEHWLQCYTKIIATQSSFCVALSGGSTPKSLYRLLARAKYSDRMDWKKIQVFFGDERCVPLDHDDSNYLMAKTALFDHIDIPADNIHPVRYEKESPDLSASAYQQQLDKVLPKGANGIPAFDLLLLGMGDDGHTASLFPETTILQETKRLVSEVRVEKLDTWRISVTYPIINHAKNIMVLVSGAGKADKISEIFNNASQNISYPIQAIVPQGDMLWLLDTAAAASLGDTSISENIRKIA